MVSALRFGIADRVNRPQTAQSKKQVISPTPISTAAFLQIKASTSSSLMAPALLSVSLELEAQELRYDCISRSTQVMRRHMVWMHRTS